MTTPDEKPGGAPSASPRRADCPLFTVFTPAYNRAATLRRVYDSLHAQTNRSFEWLVVDDGSSDNIRELIEQWQGEADFPIRYFFQKNSGKHIAFNRGVREARGAFFLTLDSDDGCVPEALERFRFHWDAIPEGERPLFSAVSSLCRDQHGRLVGSRFPFDPTDSDSLEIRYKYKVTGEKWGFHRTDVLREFPFPETVRCTYLPEGLIWQKIARKYRTRYVNEALRIYWIDQPSMVHHQDPSRNAPGRQIYLRSVLNDETDWFRAAPVAFLRAAVNYSRSSLHAGSGVWEQARALEPGLGKALWVAGLPLGYLLYAREAVMSTRRGS